MRDRRAAKGIAAPCRQGARTPRHRATERLNEIDRNVAEHLDIKLVLGNASTHDVSERPAVGATPPPLTLRPELRQLERELTPRGRTNAAIKILNSGERYLERFNASGR
jgi:hypothetical protein